MPSSKTKKLQHFPLSLSTIFSLHPDLLVSECTLTKSWKWLISRSRESINFLHTDRSLFNSIFTTPAVGMQTSRLCYTVAVERLSSALMLEATHQASSLNVHDSNCNPQSRIWKIQFRMMQWHVYLIISAPRLYTSSFYKQVNDSLKISAGHTRSAQINQSINN